MDKVVLLYNPNNHLISLQDVVEILNACEVNYQPRDLSIYQKSLTHQSYIVVTNKNLIYDILPNCVELQPESNERLEYLGDSVIGMIISSYLYHRYPKMDEGFLTKLKTKLVRTNALSKYSMIIGLPQHILISKHVEDICNGRNNERILEDTFEAFVGALYEDVYHSDMSNHGLAMQVCADFIVKLMEDNTDFGELIANNDNYKEQLLQLFHKYWVGVHPVYKELSVTGTANKRIFTMGVHHPLTNELIGSGTSAKKHTAEQMASQEALKYFDLHPPTISPEKLAVLQNKQM